MLNFLGDIEMASIMIDDTISEDEVNRNRDRYYQIKIPSESDNFQYALSLIRAKNKRTVAEGLSLFQNLFSKTHDEDYKRDSLYYMAIGK